MDMQWRTGKNDPPRGKPKVYFSSCKKDFKKYFDKVCRQLFHICDCAVYYYDTNGDVEIDDSYRFNLGQMRLFVIPVTAELLYTSNRTMSYDIQYALENHIPILPLIQEPNLENEFNNQFGNLQFLNENNTDSSALPFDIKLETFIKSILVDNTLSDEVRDSFDARVFLSYRKKDREYAQNLMSLIHNNPKLWRVAIWYDEFLIPGENFENNILKELEQSQLFVLAVTPNILEPGNYVMKKEYPEAQNVLPIIPAELSPTNIDELKRYFPGICDPVNAYDNRMLTEVLSDSLHDKLRDEVDAHQIYLLGVAYLMGIDVEKNTGRALELLEAAAEQCDPEAAKLLAKTFFSGNGFPRDYEKAKLWLQRHVEIQKEAYETRDDEESAVEYSNALEGAGILCSLMMEYKTALKYFKANIAIVSELCEKYDYSKELLARGYGYVGNTFDDIGDHVNALRAEKEELKIVSHLYENARNIYVRHYMYDCYRKLAGTYMELTYLSDALECYLKALEILRVIVKVKAQSDNCLYMDLINLCDDIGDLLRQCGHKRQAELYEKEADDAFEALKEADGIEYSKLERYYFKRDKTRDAVRTLQASIDAINNNVTRDPSSLKELGNLYSMLGYVWEAKGKKAKASECFISSIEVYEELARDFCGVAAKYDLLDAYVSFADFCDTTMDFGPYDALYSGYRVSSKEKVDLENAYNCYRAALNILDELGDDWRLWEYRQKKLEVIDALGRICKALGQKDESITYFSESLRLCRAFVKEVRSEYNYNLFAETCFKYALVSLQRDKMEQAYEIWEELSAKNPENPKYCKMKKEALRLLK